MLLEARAAHRVTEADAARWAQDIYGLEASARALPGEYDDNFQLISVDGRAFVLKVMHPAREPSFIDLQCKALVHLAERAPQLPLPRVLPNRSGELFSEITSTDGSKRLVWLLSFLKGTVLAEVRPHAPELLRDLGRFLGEMDAALQSFQHAAAHRELNGIPREPVGSRSISGRFKELNGARWPKSSSNFMKRKLCPGCRACAAA